jgi:hypothetical protein
MPQDREECLVQRNQLYRRSSGASARVEVPVVTREPSEERFFCEWRLDGTWEKNNAVLRDRIRVRAHHDPNRALGSWTPNP